MLTIKNGSEPIPGAIAVVSIRGAREFSIDLFYGPYSLKMGVSDSQGVIRLNLYD